MLGVYRICRICVPVLFGALAVVLCGRFDSHRQSMLRQLDDVRHLAHGWRVEVYAGEGDITVKGVDDIKTPPWLRKRFAGGAVVQGSEPSATLEITSDRDQEVQLLLKGRRLTADDGKVMAIDSDYRSLVIDGEEKLPAPVSVCHDRPFKIAFKASAGKRHVVNVGLKQRNYRTEELAGLASRRYSGEKRQKVLRALKLSEDPVRWRGLDLLASLGFKIGLTAALVILLLGLMIGTRHTGDSNGDRRLPDWGWLLGALMIWAFTVIVVLLVGEKPTDSQYFTYVGRCLNTGRRLYTDIWDCKGPILYWVSALGVWVNSQWGFRVLFAAFWLADLILFWSLMRRLGKNAGPATFLFVLFALGCGMDSFLVIGRQEALGAFAVLAALHLDCRGHGRRWPCLAIGICSGVAFMIKPTFAAFGIYLLVRWWMDAAENRNWKAFAIRIGCAVVGGVSVLAVCTAVYLPDQVYELWRGALLWNLCERIGRCPSGHWFMRLFAGCKFLWQYGWIFLLWASLSIIGVYAGRRCRKRAWPWIAWLAVEAVLMFKIADFYGHYVIIASLSTICLLAIALSSDAFRSLVLCASVAFMWAALGTVSVRFADVNSRQAELDQMDKLGCGQNDHIAVYGGNSVFFCLNQLRALSDQRYLFFECWISRCDKIGAEEMKEDFRRALADPRCEFFFCGYPIEAVKRKMPFAELDRFSLAFEARKLHVWVYRKIPEAMSP